MKTAVSKLFVMIFLFIPVIAHADAATDLITLLNSTRTMQASFIQEAGGKSSRLQHNSMGTMVVERPGRFRWDIVQPSHIIVIADGKKVWIHNIDLLQVTVQSLAKSIGATPAAILSGDGNDLLGHYSVRGLANDQGQAFTLHAKNARETYTDLDLFFKQGKIQKMKIVDKMGQQSVVTFSNVTVNVPLRPHLFSFTPPRGVDVINNG